MAKYIYLRVSTTKQDYSQQLQEIINYGIDPASVDEIVEEKESGGKSYTERKLNDLIAKCQKGDVIYVASTDRVGRCFFDMVKLMMYCSERGITMIACKQRLSLSADDFASKVILNITALFDEDERLRIQRRTKNKKAWQRQQIEEKGYYIVEKGVHKGEPWYWMGTSPARIPRRHVNNLSYPRNKTLCAVTKSHNMSGCVCNSSKASHRAKLWKSLTNYIRLNLTCSISAQKTAR